MLARVWIVTLLLLGLTGGTATRAANAFIGSAIATGLMESYPENNMGAVGWTPAGTIQNEACGTVTNPFACRNRGLIKFDIAGAIPPGSVIKGVSFRVWVTVQPPNDETDSNNLFDYHRVLVPWGEGTGDNTALFPGQVGRPALPGESSWLMRLAPTNAWTIPGGAEGFDYVAQPSGSVFVAQETGTQNDYNVLAISNRLVADVQFWLDNPGLNFGWLHKGQDENARWTAKRFMTVESGIDDYPRLEVTFLPPPLLSNFQTNSTGTSFEFTAEAGQAYIAQFSDSLGPASWTVLTNIPAPMEETLIVVQDTGPLATNRFYRVIAPQ